MPGKHQSAMTFQRSVNPVEQPIGPRPPQQRFVKASDLREMLNTLFRRKHVIIATIAVAMLATSIFVALAKRQYTAGLEILFENQAGGGSEIAGVFSDLAAMINEVKEKERVGICFDTCHAFAAGYDLRTPDTYAATMGQFDELIGLERLKCFHFNDSKKGLGSHVDRHDHIGTGMLGLEPFRFLLNDPRLQNVPKILETPKSEDMHEDVENLQVLSGLLREESQS
jgi:apurinic endonuclease APN1